MVIVILIDNVGLEEVVEESDDDVYPCSQADEIDLSPPSFTDDDLSSEYLFLVVHGGCGLQHGAVDMANHDIDFRTLKTTLEEVLNTHYHFARGRVTVKSIPTPNIGTKVYETLSSLSPTQNTSLSENTQKSDPNFIFPISALPILATADPAYPGSLRQLIISANIIYEDFLDSRSVSKSFNGHVCILADSLGSVMVYDILSRCMGGDHEHSKAESSSTTPPISRPRHRTSSDESSLRFLFDVSNVFMFGSPLGLILSHRQMTGIKCK